MEAPASTEAKLNQLLENYSFIQYPLRERLTCAAFNVGDKVFVSMSMGKSEAGSAKSAGRLFARARVIDTAPAAFPGRIKVEYGDGSTYHTQTWRLTPRRLCPSEATGILVTAETSHYRRLARTQISSNDVVIEIGCDFGPTVELIAQTVGLENVIGIDKSSDSIKIAKESHPDCQFIEMDIFRTPQELIQLTQKCSKILIDINGNRLLGAVVDALILVLQNSPKVDLIIVKSVELHRYLEKK
ncbi:hypothetical protein THRCLA_02962 [Thraustotheca clavata]|uniref:Methyltransferase domain-containing protein n=1 Tax=Thraustotheca clavata TaxID=74557 RepID=A0A1W0A3K3_9STRA|nr:hypothetical protein THRCLA_02962 [Thraustotheca clavata]